MVKFDFAIGNPPYNEDFNNSGDNKTYASPVYDKFMDAAYEVADKVELVHPARFLFDAGSTPKAWNRKMLNDEHFKVMEYEEDCSKVFSNTDIKGGVAITYRDRQKTFGAIGVFTPYEELNSILHKTNAAESQLSMKKVVITRTAYRLTESLHKEHPEALSQLSKGHPYDMSTNIFDRLPQVFTDKRPNDGCEYVRILGRKDNSRTYMYIKSKYVNTPDNLHAYKVYIPSANGNGLFGEALTSPVISKPGDGATETFISIGCYKTIEEAKNTLAYIKTKFARALLGVLKTTQHLTPEVWKYVPLQNFTDKSDINWNTSIANIDKQLYKKYNLTEEEINFIETHVKEME